MDVIDLKVLLNNWEENKIKIVIIKKTIIF